MHSTDKKDNVERIALVAGATGATGKSLLKYLHHSKAYSKIIVFTRKPLDIIFENLEERIVDFNHLPENIFAHDVFCCLGTTIQKAKTKQAFRQVDFDYVLNLARIQHQLGSTRFAVVSALGASTKSPFFYNRVKGEMENALKEIGYQSLYIFRPSFIQATRLEKRNGERLALLLFRLLNPFLVGSMRKYQSVPANSIAKAMTLKTLHAEPGVHIVLSDEIKNYA